MFLFSERETSAFLAANQKNEIVPKAPISGKKAMFGSPDLWNLKGTKQRLQTDQSRERGGAFPFELAYRLIDMISVKFDVVSHPFLGTGTTSLAAPCSCSIAFELKLFQTSKGES